MAQLKVLDEISLPGSPDRENEDAYGATGTIAFVLDGVTGLADELLLPGRSDAAWAAQTARTLLLEHGPGRGGDLRGLIWTVAQGIQQRFEHERSRAPAERYELPWTTISMIGIAGDTLHIAYLGDSRVLVETADGAVHNLGMYKSRTPFEQKLAQKVAAAQKEKGGDIGATARATVMSELRRARNTVNTPNGFWLLGADPEAAAHVGITSLKLAGPATVLLTTDGFYALREDYEVFDDRDLIATGQTLGLAPMGVQLRKIENDDPNGQRYARMKKSDDATALLVRVTP